MLTRAGAARRESYSQAPGLSPPLSSTAFPAVVYSDVKARSTLQRIEIHKNVR